MKIFKLAIIIIIFYGCNNKDKFVNISDSFDFLTYKIDKKNIKLYENQNITEVRFQILDLKKCECEYSYSQEWNNSRRSIIQFNLSDAYNVSSHNTGGGIHGIIEINFEKESVYYGTSQTWGNKVILYTTDEDVHQIGKAFENLKNICQKNNKSDLFTN